MKDWSQLGFSEGFNSRLDYIMCYYWMTMGVCWMVMLLCSYFLWVCVGSLNHWPMPEFIRLSMCMHMKNNEKLESSYVLFFIFLGILLATYAYQTLYHVEAPAVSGYAIGVMAIGHQWYWSYEYTMSTSIGYKGEGVGTKIDYESHAVSENPSVELDTSFTGPEVSSEVIVDISSYKTAYTFLRCLARYLYMCCTHPYGPRGMWNIDNDGFFKYIVSVWNGYGLDMGLPFAELESEEKAKVVNYSFYKGSVDNVMSLPYGRPINLSCTSEDVIHGFSVPGLGVKIDCIPGRINATKVLEAKSGVYFGQCHALCGTHHSSMPIRVDLIESQDFSRWFTSSGEQGWLD
uniref:cytochrome-c oxidase n=1 Tax=Hiatella sp. J YW-2023 TaxID=3074278 RepID=A0AA51UHV6_9BIVA|nr:cytochrome c oxidase subunit 2 [Hiatella sp. J YW-2023]